MSRMVDLIRRTQAAITAASRLRAATCTKEGLRVVEAAQKQVQELTKTARSTSPRTRAQIRSIQSEWRQLQNTVWRRCDRDPNALLSDYRHPRPPKPLRGARFRRRYR